MATPSRPAHRTFPPWNSTSWTTGPPTTPSGPASSAATAPRIRLLRRAALRQRAAALRAPADRLRQDIVPRYRTMRGYKVERRFGWDTHGPPAELEVQRQLGITDKAQIEAMGIEKFNDACRASVLKYTDEWRAYVTVRRAGWTSTTTTRPSTCRSWSRSSGRSSSSGTGLAYEGVGSCRTAGTTRPAVQPRIADGRRRLPEPPGPGHHRRLPGERPRPDLDGAHLLIWTTTLDPAVQPGRRGQSRRHVCACAGGGSAVRAGAGTPGRLRPGTGRESRRSWAPCPASSCWGALYLPPFPYFLDSPNAFQVLRGDFVTTEDGTGIVHMAPAAAGMTRPPPTRWASCQ